MILTERPFLADVVASTSSSLSPARIARVPRVERPAIQPNVLTITVQLDLLLCRIVASLAQRLQSIESDEELHAITAVRLNVVDNGRWLHDAFLQTEFAQWMFAQLMPTYPLPARRRVQLSPGTWLATHTHGLASCNR
jgi:hypothetical protein